MDLCQRSKRKTLKGSSPLDLSSRNGVWAGFPQITEKWQSPGACVQNSNSQPSVAHYGIWIPWEWPEDYGVGVAKVIPQIRKPGPLWGQGVESTWLLSHRGSTFLSVTITQEVGRCWLQLKELSRGAVQVTHSLGLCDTNLEEYHPWSAYRTSVMAG